MSLLVRLEAADQSRAPLPRAPAGLPDPLAASQGEELPATSCPAALLLVSAPPATRSRNSSTARLPVSSALDLPLSHVPELSPAGNSHGRARSRAVPGLPEQPASCPRSPSAVTSPDEPHLRSSISGSSAARRSPAMELRCAPPTASTRRICSIPKVALTNAKSTYPAWPLHRRVTPGLPRLQAELASAPPPGPAPRLPSQPPQPRRPPWRLPLLPSRSVRRRIHGGAAEIRRPYERPFVRR